MNKVAHYLQEHVSGEVLTGDDVRRYFATDGSILSLPPAIVVYPRNENDVRKTARFTWQLAERGRVIPLTARGLGSNLTGSALGAGIMLAFPAHLNRLLALDGKTGRVTVEPGLNYGKMQQALLTHGRQLPCYPASLEYSTIGGAIATNAAGERSFKYGTTRDYVRRLRVVLANGEVIETGRLSKRELGKKLGLTTFEGEVYRNLDKLLEENESVLASLAGSTTRNACGYALQMVRGERGSFDLTPLFVGSEGTLGLVTEATLDTLPNGAPADVLAVMLEDAAKVQELVQELRRLRLPPASAELLNRGLLEMAQRHNPNALAGVLEPPLPPFVLLLEVDDQSERLRRKALKKIQKLLDKRGLVYRLEKEADKRDELKKLRRLTATAMALTDGGRRAVPFIEDGIVPVERLAEALERFSRLAADGDGPTAIWGHAGDGHLRVMPLMDLGQLGDRQKLFKMMDEHWRVISELGGSLSAQHGDGRLRGPYLTAQVGDDAYGLFTAVKKVFDPFGTLNPGVKLGVSAGDVRQLLRSEYSLGHFYAHLPQT